MKKKLVLPVAVLVFMVSGPVLAHFGMLIPSQATVSKADPKTVDLLISFSHPMEMVGMDMAKPKAFGVVAGGSPAAGGVAASIAGCGGASGVGGMAGGCGSIYLSLTGFRPSCQRRPWTGSPSAIAFRPRKDPRPCDSSPST